MIYEEFLFSPKYLGYNSSKGMLHYGNPFAKQQLESVTGEGMSNVYWSTT